MTKRTLQKPNTTNDCVHIIVAVSKAVAYQVTTDTIELVHEGFAEKDGTLIFGNWVWLPSVFLKDAWKEDL